MSKLTQIEEYFKTEALSQSTLLKYQNHPRWFERKKKKEEKRKKDLYYEEKEHFLKGSVVDVLLTMPEHFEDLYYIDKLEKKPTDAVMSIINYLVDHNIYLDDVIAIREVCQQYEYGNNWGDKVLMQRIADGGTSGRNVIKNLGKDYYEMLNNSKGKEILSEQEYKACENVVAGFKDNPNTSFFFDNTDPEIEIIFQLPIYSEISLKNYTLKIKGLLDILVINHSDKPKKLAEWLTMPSKSVLETDIKTTTGYLDNYQVDIKRRRYDVQRAWYKKLVGKYLIQKSKDEKRDLLIYDILLPCIIVNSFSEPDYPKVYQFSFEDMYIAKNGLEEKEDGIVVTNLDEYVGKVKKSLKNPILGVKQLLERYVYFEENGYKWEKQENKGAEKTNLWL